MAKSSESNPVPPGAAATEGRRPSPSSEKFPHESEGVIHEGERLIQMAQEGRGPETTDSNVRYAAYAARVRTILSATQRYVAYTSDIGESFRPVAHPWLVRGAYGVSWAYLTGDVTYEAYKAYQRNQQMRHPERFVDRDDTGPVPLPSYVHPLDDYRTIAVQRTLFQSIASMGLPAFTIHSIVRYSGQAFKKSSVKSPVVRTWAPIGLGLSAIPFLPYMFDHPVETAVEWLFEKASIAAGYGPRPNPESSHQTIDTEDKIQTIGSNVKAEAQELYREPPPTAAEKAARKALQEENKSSSILSRIFGPGEDQNKPKKD